MWLVKATRGTCAVRGGKRPSPTREVVRTACGAMLATALGVYDGDAPTCSGCAAVVSRRRQGARP